MPAKQSSQQANRPAPGCPAAASESAGGEAGDETGSVARLGIGVWTVASAPPAAVKERCCACSTSARGAVCNTACQFDQGLAVHDMAWPPHAGDHTAAGSNIQAGTSSDRSLRWSSKPHRQTGMSAFGQRLVHRDRPTEPWMPRITNFSRLSTMGVALSKLHNRAPAPSSTVSRTTGAKARIGRVGSGRTSCSPSRPSRWCGSRVRLGGVTGFSHPTGCDSGEHGAVECEARLRAVPGDELANRVLVGPLAAGGRQAVEDCGLGVFEIGQGEDAFGRFLTTGLGMWASATASFNRRREPC